MAAKEQIVTLFPYPVKICRISFLQSGISKKKNIAII
jgi:hypothetical protein